MGPELVAHAVGLLGSLQIPKTITAKNSKQLCNTFHLPPSGQLCDHPELSYCRLSYCTMSICMLHAVCACNKNQNYIAIPYI